MRLTVALVALSALTVSACGDGSDAEPPDATVVEAPDSGAVRDAGRDAPSSADSGGGGLDEDGDGVPAPLDCDDTDPAIHPGADERCNGTDDDCDERIDEEPVDPSTFYRDADGDGHGVASDERQACSAPAGYAAQDGDCDDTDAAVRPGVAETCNLFDDDCDERVDEEAVDFRTYYVDADRDGFGDMSMPVSSCDATAPAGASDIGTDCDDSSPSINPTASERCSTVGVDDDCDTAVDEATATDAPLWYRDADRDGYGNALISVRACANPSTASVVWVSNSTDCNDENASSYPGAADAPDIDGNDSNCDGADGDAATAIFVGSCSCSTSGPGTRVSPYCTIAQGLAAAASRSRTQLIVANGVYAETVALRSGISIAGGYNCSGGWSRSLSPTATTIRAPAGENVSVTATGITQPVVLEGLAIVGPDMSARPGVESVALRVRNTVDATRLILRRSSVTGGAGGHGSSGDAGSLRACSTSGGGGGARSSGACGSDGGGSGQAGESVGGGGGGAGTSQCLGTCGDINYTGISAGSRGGDGTPGANGAGSTYSVAAAGTFAADGDWTAAAASMPGDGRHGGGGGGGGQGGSKGQCGCIDCCQTRFGARGGAGGRGGCGGGAGGNGGSGGASIALLLVGSQVTLDGVTIALGRGGNGGSGGGGAHGESGPGGTAGGDRYSWQCSAGIWYGAEAGGPGGSGGHGGGGAGGSAGYGGPSWGLVRVGTSGVTGTPTYVATTPATAGSAGAGGSQGVTGVRAPAGASASAGVVQDVRP